LVISQLQLATSATPSRPLPYLNGNPKIVIIKTSKLFMDNKYFNMKTALSDSKAEEEKMLK